ncbi:Zinc-responsive transcriptional regulator, partial [Lachnellula occidentalis]
MPPENAYHPLHPPQPPKTDTRKLKLRARSPQVPAATRPSSKRKRVEPEIRSDEGNAVEACPSESGSLSTCCSSCPDSPPCAEPDCNLALLVPCTEKTCGVPFCTDPCLDTDSHNQLSISDQQIRLAQWNDSVWNPQSPGPSSHRGGRFHGDVVDHTLGGFDHPAHPAAALPYSNPPSMVNDGSSTLNSPYTSQHAPRPNAFPSSYRTEVLSAGAVSSPSIDAFNQQSFGLPSSDQGSFNINCRWDGCEQASFPSQVDWNSHFHQNHLDPQLTFYCPISGQDIPLDNGVNMVDHLKDGHGYSFMDGNSLSCPAVTCDSTEKYCDPSRLHNHFDHAHAMPTGGMLSCRLDTCNASFPDQVTLISHLNESHDLLIPFPSIDGIDLPQSSVVANDSTPEKGTPDDGPAHSCKWVTGLSTCEKICTSEVDLQNHVANDHLNMLERFSGYHCQWFGCGRRDKRAEKSGFSQRGKLERHMATHTGYKCATCDMCGKTFSAEQSMKQHKLLHTGVKPWQCKYCDKSFPQQSACTIHERTHTRSKPLICNICGKAFSESSNLSKHRKIHGEKGTHSCSYRGCIKSFHRLDQLKRHQIVHKRAESRMNQGIASTLGSESESGMNKTE